MKGKNLVIGMLIAVAIIVVAIYFSMQFVFQQM